MKRPPSKPHPPGKVKEVTSLANPVVKSIRALGRKRNREEEGVFVAEGVKLIIEAIELGWTVRTLVIAKDARASGAIADLASLAVARGSDVILAGSKILAALTRRENPQNAMAVIEQSYSSLPGEPGNPGDVWVVLEQVRDPGNLGTILRSVDASGATGVILAGECVDPFSIEAVRASMGSIFAVPIVRVSQSGFLQWRSHWTGLVVGTHLDGKIDYREVDYGQEPVLLLMGNEQAGLTDRFAEACTHLVRIPQSGRADSLNLAVATGLMLFEARRNFLKLESGR